MGDLYSSSRMLPLFCVLTLGMLAQQQGAEALYYPADKIVAYGDTWQGLSAPRLQAEFYKRFMSFSYDKNPGKDVTGGLQGLQQNVKRVFFLDSTGSSEPEIRSATVKANRALFFPLFALSYVSTDLTPVASVYADIPDQLDAYNFTAVTASVDGQIIQDPVQYIGRSSTFAYTFPGINEANVFNITSFYDTRTKKFGLTSYPNLAYGVFLFLKPLPKGLHIIKLKVKLINDVTKFDVTYRITVV